MNSDSEAEQFVSWLLQKLALTETAPSGKHGSSTEPTTQSLHTPDSDDINGLDTEKGSHSGRPSQPSNVFSFRDTPPHTPGEFSAVQDRFYSLLKRRLRTEIEQKPPLFPWENELLDYAAEPASVRFWSQQLQNLSLPVAMPEAVLEQLLERSQAVLQSSLQEGAKLVRAVESLFPQQEQALNHLASMVMAAPARSNRSALIATEDAPFPANYETATDAQKMALSLIATQEIFNTLALSVRVGESAESREWETEVGIISLQAEAPEAGTVRVRAQLPCGGCVEFHGLDAEAVAQRSDAGKLGVELFGLQPDHSYPLQIHLAVPNQPSLTFQIALA
jgi:hypothetical protein